MLEWLNSHIVYWHWIVLGLCLATAEMMLFSFVLLWFGVSAIIVGLLVWIFPMIFSLQIMIWILLSILIICMWFQHIAPYLKQKSITDQSDELIIGQVGLVIDYHLAHEGRGVLRFSTPILGADEWEFECADNLQVGQRVVVDKLVNNRVMVSAK